MRDGSPADVEAALVRVADINARNRDGQTPLHVAAWANKNPEVTKALLTAVADINSRDDEDETHN